MLSCLILAGHIWIQQGSNSSDMLNLNVIQGVQKHPGGTVMTLRAGLLTGRIILPESYKELDVSQTLRQLETDCS